MACLGEFEQLILFALLDLGNDAYGVAIRESIEERTGRTVFIGGDLHGAGSSRGAGHGVFSRLDKPTEGPGRPPKFYDLDPAGACSLMDAWETMQSMAGGLIPRLTEHAEG